MTKKPNTLYAALFFITLIAFSAYAFPIQSVQATGITNEQKNMDFLNDVFGIDTTKYVTSAKEYPQDFYMSVLPQENLYFELNSDASKLRGLSTFIDGKLQMVHVLDLEGPAFMRKPTTDIVETAKAFLSSYQSYSGNALYEELGAILANVKENENVTKTFGNTKLEVTCRQERVSFKWTYLFNGVEAPDKAVALTYENGFLKLFFDSWDLYKIGSTDVNVSEEEAVDIAMAYIASNTKEFSVKDFKMTGAMITETVFRSSLVADIARSDDLLMLYPIRHVWISLDKFYPPGNVYGFNVYVWADTGEICHIHERFSSVDPPTELVATIENTERALTEPASSNELTTNSLPTIWLVVPVIMATIIVTMQSLSKKRGLIMKRFSKANGALLCALLLSMLLVSIATVAATYPYGRATIWGSESTGAWDPNIPPDGASWRKHPNEVDKQRETADDIEGSFNWNGYNASNYQGSNGLGSSKTAILAQISENEVNYQRVAVVVFNHGNWREDYSLDPGKRHYLFEDNVGTWEDVAWNPENGVYDMDIFDLTEGRTFFTFISTCNSANIDVQNYNNGKPQGMAYAWTHHWITGPNSTPPYGYMSGNGYTHADSGNFAYIGFDGGSPSLSLPVEGSWPYYHTWVKQFLAYGLIYDMSVNDALDHASASLWSGNLFDETPLYNGFDAIWQMYLGDPPSWQNETGEGWMKVYGNGDLKLYQPLLTVNAYDSSSNPVSADVYIDGVFMGTTGNSFRVTPGTRTVRVESSSHTFHHFTGYSDFENPIQISVSSATTVTANYYANPPPQYTLSISAGEGGTTQAPYTPGNHQCTPGLVTVTAEPDSGYEFDYWLLDGQTHLQNPITIPMNDDHTLQAVFQDERPIYALTVLARGFGTEVLYPDVYIDGQYVGYSEETYYVREGYHTIELDSYVDGWLFDYYYIDGQIYHDPLVQINVTSNLTILAEYSTGK